MEVNNINFKLKSMLVVGLQNSKQLSMAAHTPSFLVLFLKEA